MTFLKGGLAERFPHVHDGQADSPALLWTEPGEELVQAGFGTILATKPDSASSLQVADHDAILMTLGDGDFIDADDTRRGTTGSAELLPHVLLVQFLDSMPVEVQFTRHGLDGAFPAASTHEESKPLGVERVVCQPLQPLALHAAALAAPDPANRELQVNPLVPTGQVAHSARTLIVEGAIGTPAHAAARAVRCRPRP